MRFMRQNDSRNGFTLMELLTVMAIMGIILTAGIASYFGARRGAEMRGAVGAIRSALTTARQNAVTHRRSTAVVFRAEGPAATATNCFYIFEKHGEVKSVNGTALFTDKAPLPEPDLWPRAAYIFNFDALDGSSGTRVVGRVGKTKDAYLKDGVNTDWTIDSASSDNWKAGDSYGLQVVEKGYIPPGIRCEVDGKSSGMIRFYANGKSLGVEPVPILLVDKVNEAVKKELVVYPLLGLVVEKKN